MNVIVPLIYNTPNKCTQFRDGFENVHVFAAEVPSAEHTFIELIFWFMCGFLRQKTRRLLVTVNIETVNGGAAVGGYSQEMQTEERSKRGRIHA